MEPAHDILKIRERMFDDSFFDDIFGLYQKECREEGSGVSEKEYDEAKARLPALLPKEQLVCLCEAEVLCFEIARWLAEFAFARGVYAGFGQHFAHGGSADQFKPLVFEAALQMPGMQRYPEYRARREKANDRFIRSRKHVSPAAADQVAEIELAWQNRFLGVCRHAFPLGCRFAFSLIGEPAFAGVFVRETKELPRGGEDT